ncbi:hypothetical protein [Caudoviricetes sp.]|nr:hypothetical protein [Caudoviricetes sp.]
MTDTKISKGEKLISFLSLWVARLALATLAVAGGIHFLGGVDPIIAYPFVGISVAFLLKETL